MGEGREPRRRSMLKNAYAPSGLGEIWGANLALKRQAL
jgi:hypothetical protein